MEGSHTKKLFKNPATRPGAGHRITQIRHFFSEMRFSDWEAEGVHTDLVVLVKVAHKYGRFEADCRLYNTRLTITKTQDYLGKPLDQSYACTYSNVGLHLVGDDNLYRLTIKGSSPFADVALDPAPHYQHTRQTMLSEEKMKEYVLTLITIPDIANEIQKHLPK